jgi:HAD superfamily hydrolase (TIGR01509 family)
VSKLAAVLFDMDGTLVETESLWHETEIETMRQFGYDWTLTDQDLAVGGPMDAVVVYMSERCGAPAAQIAAVLRDAIEAKMVAGPLHILPGVLDLHADVVRAGIPAALVSNSWRALMDIVLAALEPAGITFDATVAGDEISPNKPDPAPYLRAAQLLGVDATLCVAVEDSTTGVVSATEAGCFVVAVPQVNVIESGPRRRVVSSLVGLSVVQLEAWLAG